MTTLTLEATIISAGFTSTRKATVDGPLTEVPRGMLEELLPLLLDGTDEVEVDGEPVEFSVPAPPSVRELLERDGEPRLGCATTRQLLEELAARMHDTQNSTAGRALGRDCIAALANLDRGVLNYRTVDS